MKRLSCVFLCLALFKFEWAVAEDHADTLKERIQQLVDIINKRNEELKTLQTRLGESENRVAVLQVAQEGAQRRIEELEKEKKLDRAGEVDPLKRAFFGDWARFKVAKTAGGKNENYELLRTLVRIDEKRFMLIEEKLAGEKIERPDAVSVTTEDFNPLQPPAGVEVEKLGEGQELLKAAGKEFACHWVRGRFKDGAKTVDRKVWFAKSAPLAGIVKVEETATDGSTTVTELTGYQARYDRTMPKP